MGSKEELKESTKSVEECRTDKDMSRLQKEGDVSNEKHSVMNMRKGNIGVNAESRTISISDTQQNDDEDFVENVMKTKVSSIDMKNIRADTASKHLNNSHFESGEEIVKEKRKRELSGQSEGSEINERTDKAKQKHKRSKLVSPNRSSITEIYNSYNGSDDEFSDAQDTDISVTLKALSILEKKIDQRFDELKESNTVSINKLQTEIHSVRRDFNHRIDGLSKKVEARVTDTVLKNVNDKMKNVKSDLRREISRELSRELSNDDKVESLKRQIEEIQGTVSDVINHTSNSRASDDIALNIAIRNLGERENENTLNKVNALIKDGLRLRNISCKKAVRKQARSDLQQGVVIATCESLDAKKEIMKNKSKLKDIRQYERVFIEHDRPRAERNQISNLRRLVNVVGRDRLRVQGSRVVFTEQDEDRSRGERNHNDGHSSSTRNVHEYSGRGQSGHRHRQNSYLERDMEGRRHTRQGAERREYDSRRSSDRHNPDSSRERYSRR